VCDPVWHVSFRSGVATLRTAIHLLHYITLAELSTGCVDPSVGGVGSGRDFSVLGGSRWVECTTAKVLSV